MVAFSNILIAVNIQVALPCIIWVFPELKSGHTPTFDCCEYKLIGSQRYSFVGRTRETSDFNCNSDCVYSKDGEPNSRYCFKDGGNEYPECENSVTINLRDEMETVYKCVPPGSIVLFGSNGKLEVCRDDQCNETPYNFTTPQKSGSYLFTFKNGNGNAEILASHNCTCPSAGEDNHEWSTSLATVKHNLEIALKGSDHSVDTHKQIMEAFFKLDFLILSPDQEKVLFDSKPCDPVRINCRLCMDFLLSTTIACIEGYSSCEKRKDETEKECNRCLCDLSKACFPSISCPQATSKVPAESNKSPHPCDRNCNSNTEPLKCVFNLSLTMVYSGEDGLKLDGGSKRSVLAYNGQVPGPPIVICEGDTLVVNLENNLSEDMVNIDGSQNTTTLHFHGIREINRPWSDGVPHVTQCPIPPGGNFTYGFTPSRDVRFPPGTYGDVGTFWYHSHVGDQRTNGAYGALIVRPTNRELDTRYDVDEVKYTMLLQEWYESSADRTIKSLLINGQGRIDSESTSKYMEYDVTHETKYLFRVIGAMSEDVPLRLSIEGHTFTAIAADSQDIQPVHNLKDLWIAVGERFHIVVHTKTAKETQQINGYKIKVFGYANPNGPKNGPNKKSGPYCTIAWLKYPGHITENVYQDCTDFELTTPRRTLNPVPMDYSTWSDRLTYPEWNDTEHNGTIYVNDLRSKTNTSFFFFGQDLLTTQYIEFVGQTFNGISMSYNDVPFLLQTKPHEENLCGTVCDYTVYPTRNLTYALKQQYLVTNCTSTGCKPAPGESCRCQHVLKQVYAPGYWTELVLINNKLNETASHPIHQHGGWFWIVGMGKYPFDITRDFIMEKDKDCNHVSFTTAKKNNKNAQCLHRQLDLPPAKDTIQVPPGGYVILRTPTGNKGTWLIHCHINRHMQEGMAMVYQVGKNFGKTVLLQDWCTGDLPTEESCPPRPSGVTSIQWYYGMEPVERCVAPGARITFLVEGYHNVNQLSNEEDYKNCTIKSDINMEGEHIWDAPSEEKKYYLACGISDGIHCRDGGMKAKIIVSKYCPKV